MDLEVVVARAAEEVHHLDRALGAVGGELAIDECDAAETDAAGEDRWLAESLRVLGIQARAEIQILGHTEALQPGRGQRTTEVFLARVVEQVEHVDGPAFRRLRADLDQGGIFLARQLEPVVQRTVDAGRAALDRQRAAQLGQHMRRGREHLHACACQRNLVKRVGVQHNFLLHVPIGGRPGPGEGGHGRGARHGDHFGGRGDDRVL